VGRIPRAYKPEAEFAQPIGIVPATGTRARAEAVAPLGELSSKLTGHFVKTLKQQRENEDNSYTARIMFDEHRWLKENQPTFDQDPSSANEVMQARRTTVLNGAREVLGENSLHVVALETSLFNSHGRYLDGAVATRRLAVQKEAFNDATNLFSLLTEDLSETVYNGGLPAMADIEMDLVAAEEMATQFIAHGDLHNLPAGRMGQTAADVIMENLDIMNNTLMAQALSKELIDRYENDTAKIIGVTDDGNAIVGYTTEGRPIIRGESEEGTLYFTERSATVQHPELPGIWTNIPTVYDGIIVSEEEAIERAINANGFDSETNRKLSGFDTEEDASEAAVARSDMIEPAKGSRVAAEEFIQQFIADPASIGAEFGLSLLDRKAAAKIAKDRLAGVLGIADLKKQALDEALVKYREEQEQLRKDQKQLRKEHRTTLVLPFSDLLLKIEDDPNFGPAQIEMAVASLYDFESNEEEYTSKLGEAMRRYRTVTIKRADEIATAAERERAQKEKQEAKVTKSLRDEETIAVVEGLKRAGEDLSLPFPSYKDMKRVADERRRLRYPGFEGDIDKLWKAWYTAGAARLKSNLDNQAILSEFARNGELMNTEKNRTYVTNQARMSYGNIPTEPAEVMRLTPQITKLASHYGVLDNQVVSYLKSGLNNFENVSELTARMTLFADLDVNLKPDALLSRLSHKEMAFYNQMFAYTGAGGKPLDAQKIVLDRITNPDGGRSERKLLDLFNTVDLSEYLAEDGRFQSALERSVGSNWFTKMMRDRLGIGPEVTPEMMALASSTLGMVAKYYDDPDKAMEHVAKMILSRYGNSIFSQNEGAMSRPPEMHYSDVLGSVHYIKSQIHEVFEQLRETTLQKDVDQWPSHDDIFDEMGENIYLVEDRSSKARDKPSYNIWFKLEDRWEYLTDKGGTNPFKFLPDPTTSRRAMERMDIVRTIGEVQLHFEDNDGGNFFRELKPGWMDTLNVESKMLVLDASRWIKRGQTGAFLKTMDTLIKVIELTSEAYGIDKPIKAITSSISLGAKLQEAIRRGENVETNEAGELVVVPSKKKAGKK
jgi:hypothetical protein